MGDACYFSWICYILDVQKFVRANRRKWKNNWSLVYLFNCIYMCNQLSYLETHFRNYKSESNLHHCRYHFPGFLLGHFSFVEYWRNCKDDAALSEWNFWPNFMGRLESICLHYFHSSYLFVARLCFEFIYMVSKTFWNIENAFGK